MPEFADVVPLLMQQGHDLTLRQVAASAHAWPARRGGPRAVPLMLNGIEIGVVKEPCDRGLEDQAFDQLCAFAVHLYGPGSAAAGPSDLTRRRLCTARLLRSFGVVNPESATLLENLSIRRGPDGALIVATWRFEPGALPVEARHGA